MPCNPKCSSGFACKSFDKKSWCQKIRTRKITKSELRNQDRKRLFGKVQRTVKKKIVEAVGDAVTAAKDMKNKKYKLKF